MKNAAIAFAALIVAAVGFAMFAERRAAPGGVESADSVRVDGPRARALVQAGALLVDVRSPEEYAGGHLDGARNIPVDQLGARLAELPRDRGVVVYCRSGGRSAAAAELLTGEGYRVHDLGPMTAW